MEYKIQFKGSVKKDLKNIDKDDIKRIFANIEEKLSKDPYLGEPLYGKFKGLYKYRVGDYRVIYAIEKNEVWILKIGHRKHIYR